MEQFSKRPRFRLILVSLILLGMATLDWPVNDVVADERTDRLQQAARRALDRPGVKAPFPCDDGWLGSGAHVLDVTTWAEAAGLRRGDRFIAIGGVSVAVAGDWAEALARSSPQNPLEVRVERSGREINLKIPCRDNRDWWRTQRQLYEAVIAERWDACMEAVESLLRIVRQPFSVLLRWRLECWAAKLRGLGGSAPPREFSLLVYQIGNRLMEESKYRPGMFAEQRPWILSAIEQLEKQGLRLQADDLRSQLQSMAFAPSIPPPASAKVSLRLGTAFAVRPDGMLMTAYHVVEKARSIEVVCPDSGRAPALVERSSPTTDLALLRVQVGAPSTYLGFADVKSAYLGARVFTIGYPAPNLLGTEAKFAEGTISALSGPGGDASFLQISVPLHAGNSGGPLVNEKGEVVGVAIATASAPAFLRATGTLPQNINWAVKSVYASVLYDAPPRPPGISDRSEAIKRVTRATCQLIAEVEEEE